MKFEPAYWEEPRKTDFESEVVDIDGTKVFLKETYFHPEEGGQPPDRGTIAGFEVEDVQKKSGNIVHHLEENDLEKGDIVEGHIDQDFRYYCMRGHTGAHIVYGAGREVLGDVSYAGFDIGEEKARIDFETEVNVDRKKLLKIEELCNKVILEKRPVSWKELDKEEVEKSKEIAFAKEIPEGEQVRIIEIEDWDKGVCSGTHLENTLEVARIRINDKKKLQEGVTRITFSVGEKALRRDYRDRRSILRAMHILKTNPNDLPKEIRRLKDKIDEMGEKIEELESEKIEQELENLDRYELEDFELLVQNLSTEDTDQLSHRAKDEVGDEEVMVIINERETVSLLVGVGDNVEEISANEIVQTVGQEFGGGGGGTEQFAQGGGFDTEIEELKEFIIRYLEER